MSPSALFIIKSPIEERLFYLASILQNIYIAGVVGDGVVLTNIT